MKRIFLALVVAMFALSASVAQRISPSAVQEIVANRGYASQGTIHRSGLIYMGLRNGNEYHYGIDVRLSGKKFHSQSDRAVYLKVKSGSPFAAFIYFKDRRDAMDFFDGLDRTPNRGVGVSGARNFVIERPVLKDGWWMIDLAGYGNFSSSKAYNKSRNRSRIRGRR